LQEDKVVLISDPHFFINVFIIFNLTFKLKIYCYLLIYFYNFNPHSFYYYFLFWISCIVFLCNFNPYNFFMYITPSLVTWIIIWKINMDWNLFFFFFKYRRSTLCLNFLLPYIFLLYYQINQKFYLIIKLLILL